MSVKPLSRVPESEAPCRGLCQAGGGGGAPVPPPRGPHCWVSVPRREARHSAGTRRRRLARTGPAEGSGGVPVRCAVCGHRAGPGSAGLAFVPVLAELCVVPEPGALGEDVKTREPQIRVHRQIRSPRSLPDSQMFRFFSCVFSFPTYSSVYPNCRIVV